MGKCGQGLCNKKAKNRFITYIEELSKVKLNGNACNHYSHDNPVNTIRRNNLLLYFQQMEKFNSRILMVGEAPGYRGCRLTGVPFTSEFILLNGVDRFEIFGRSRGYMKTNEFIDISKESTATIMWNALERIKRLPLLWNAFPFHTFKNRCLQSNRTPTNDELKIGERYLRGLIQLFDAKAVVAIGNGAESTLINIGINFKRARHPANGGKIEFTNGIDDIMGDYQR